MMEKASKHKRILRKRSKATTKSSSSKESSKSSVSSVSKTVHQKELPQYMQTARSVWYAKVSFVLLLIAVAVSLAYGCYRVMSKAEADLAAERFQSISDRALSTAQLVLEEKKRVTDSLALMVGVTNPDARQWPNVYMEGFQQVAQSLTIVTEGSLSLCPIVTPGGEEQESFETYAYDLFRNVQGFSEDTGVSAFGEGIFSYGRGEFGNQTWPDGRYHSTNGWTYHRSPRDVLVPFLQSNFGAHQALMLNVHFEHNRAEVIDQVMTCAEERAVARDYDRECGGITDLMWSETAADVDAGPAGLMFVPIFPRNDNTTLTGFIVGKQIWYDLLKHGFESDVSGLNIVLRTERSAHTYYIEEGQVLYVGEGEMIETNPEYHATKKINTQYFSNYTLLYYMDIYSTQAFEESFQSNNPRAVSVGALMIVLGTSILFWLYDSLVRKEFHHKQQLLEAKRLFVRFVSHEVRTPLNTVCMGLTLLKQELKPYTVDSSHTKIETDGASKGNQLVPSLVAVQEWLSLVNQVYQNASESVNVLSDLLQYDKIQMGALSLELSVINIRNMLKQVVGEFKIAAQEQEVNLHLDFSALLSKPPADLEEGIDLEEVGTRNHPCASSLPHHACDTLVLGDTVRLLQVFRNLLSNGLKFSKGGRNLTVRVSEKQLPKGTSKKSETFQPSNAESDVALLLRRRSIIVVDVIDEGVGMPPEQVASVFDDGTQFNANKFQAGGGQWSWPEYRKRDSTGTSGYAHMLFKRPGPRNNVYVGASFVRIQRR